MVKRVLVIDDEPAICWSLREALTDRGRVVESAGSIEQAWQVLKTFHPDVILLDVRLPGQDGLSALPEIQDSHPETPVIVMTAHGDLPTAVTALGQNAFEYVTKPFDLNQLLETIDKALAQSLTKSTHVQTESEPVRSALIGKSQAMQEVFRQIALVASTDFPVLILGETGTGKGVVARELHRYSGRSNEAFITVCPAALNVGLVESELFGHVQGAFTGAVDHRAGLFDLANSGTIFLDEIADTPIEMQVKLLRVLESKQYRPVGSSKERSTQARVIAATNRDLGQMVEDGEFREDLFHRLKTFTIELPPLRERQSDVRPLVEFFLAESSNSTRPAGIDDSFWDAVTARPWYGNVRELRHATEHAIVLARKGILHAVHLPAPATELSTCQNATIEDHLVNASVAWVRQELSRNPDREADKLHARYLQIVESALLKETLEAANQNRTVAARILGLDRTTLRSRLKQLAEHAAE